MILALMRGKSRLKQLADENQRLRAELARTTRELQAEIAERTRMERDFRVLDTALHRAHVMTKLAHVITRPDGSVETWSENLPSLIGLADADMPQSTQAWMGLLHPDDRPAYRSAIIAAGAGASRQDLEDRLRRSDGAWIHIFQVTEPIPGPSDTDGKRRWFTTLQDVTGHKRAEEEQRESQHLLQAIIDNSAAVIFVKDLQGRYLLVNRRFVELFQIGEEAILGQSDHDLFPQETADVFRALDLRVVAAEAPMIEEEFVPHDDGLHTYVAVKFPLRDQHGHVRGVCGIATDITDRKLAENALIARTEELRFVNQELDAFTRTAAHDLKTPLNAISGFIQILRFRYGAALGAEGDRMAEHVETSAKAMAHLVNDLMALSRVSTHELRLVRVDISAMARSIIDGLQATEPDREVTVQIAQGLQAQADEGLLRSLMTNLLSNAWKYSSKRSRASIDVGCSESTGAPVFFVRDNGVGFDISNAERLFEPFQRFHSAGEFAGSGVGLATCKRIVQRHGGSIWVTSAPGEGTTVFFSLGPSSGDAPDPTIPKDSFVATFD